MHMHTAYDETSTEPTEEVPSHAPQKVKSDSALIYSHLIFLKRIK